MFAARTADAPDALLLHCSLARHEALMPLARMARLDALMPDLLGHGRSPAWDGREDYQTANLAALVPLIDRPMHVVGHSFGGTIALRLAVERPDLVTRLTLIEPVFFALATGTPAFERHLADFTPIAEAVAAGSLPLAARLFHEAYGTGDWNALKPAMQESFASQMPLVVAAAPAIQDDVHGLAPRLAAIDVPLTLVRGALTQPVIGEIHADLVRRIPGARDHVIDGAGHMVPITHPQAVAPLLAR